MVGDAKWKASRLYYEHSSDTKHISENLCVTNPTLRAPAAGLRGYCSLLHFPRHGVRLIELVIAIRRQYEIKRLDVDQIKVE